MPQAYTKWYNLNMSTLPQPKPRLRVPMWVPLLYSVGALAMMPWIIHLQNTLPPQQPLARWVLTWVGFDVMMLSLILLVVVLAIKKSAWLSVALVALATLSLADAWFDIMTANGNHELTVAVSMAAFFEIPWALFSVGCAVYLHKQLIARTKS